MADRVERLTNLLALLLETRGGLTLAEIMTALGDQYPEGESGRRGAFERDKATLREIGVPIETEVVSGGDAAGATRYRIDRRRYELADLRLEPDEIAALQLAVAATRAGAPAARDALLKLGASELDDAGAVVAPLPSLPALPQLREAVAERRVVELAYGGVDREIEPWGLLLRDGFWYLIGHDRVRDARRVFRVDRIEGDVTLGRDRAAFERPPGIDLSAALAMDPKTLGADASREAVVRVDAPRSAPVVRELGDDRVVLRHASGAVDVRVPCANLDAFRSWVLGLGEHAEVLAPPDVRADVVAWLERLAGADGSAA